MPDDPIRAQVTLRRRVRASRETLFRAWTDPKALKQWFAAAEGSHVAVAEADLRVGGAYRLVVVDREGVARGVSGTYREIRPPERLVFTWASDFLRQEPGAFLVTLEFLEIDDEVEIVLTHARLRGDESVEIFERGWIPVLDSLGRYVGRLR